MAINYSSKNKNSLKKCILTNLTYVNWLLLNNYIILYEKLEIYRKFIYFNHLFIKIPNSFISIQNLSKYQEIGLSLQFYTSFIYNS